MSFECGLCEISTRQRELIRTCPEANCPYRKQRDIEDKPLSELTHEEVTRLYNDED